VKGNVPECRPSGALDYQTPCPHRFHGGLRSSAPPGASRNAPNPSRFYGAMPGSIAPRQTFVGHRQVCPHAAQNKQLNCRRTNVAGSCPRTNSGSRITSHESQITTYESRATRITNHDSPSGRRTAHRTCQSSNSPVIHFAILTMSLGCPLQGLPPYSTGKVDLPDLSPSRGRLPVKTYAQDSYAPR